MKKAAYTIIAATGVFLAACGGGTKDARPPQIVLSDGATARTKIVVPDAPTHCETYAASFLKKYLDKASGADFAIIRESAAEQGKPSIYVGATKRSKAALPDFNPDTAGYDTAVLKTYNGDVVIGGHKKRGITFKKSCLFSAAKYSNPKSSARCLTSARDWEPKCPVAAIYLSAASPN